ncbi:hypothetical protein FQZ97_885830 [compost metagenome]
MEAIREINIGVRRRTEHRSISVGGAGEAVRRGVIGQICLGLDNNSADAGHREFGADQVRRHLDGGAREKPGIPTESMHRRVVASIFA